LKVETSKLSGAGETPSKLIQSAGKTVCSEICKYIHSIWNKEELQHNGKRLLFYPLFNKNQVA
jgi:hypothetical protein